MSKRIYNVDFDLIDKAMLEAEISSYAALCRSSNIAHAHFIRSKKKEQLGFDALSKIAAVLKKPVSHFLSETQPAGTNLNQLTGSISIPVLKRVTPNLPHDTKEEDIITRLNVPGILPNSGAVIAQDDSMVPLIKNGDYALFIPAQEAKSGDIVVVNNQWGETSIKRYREKNGRISFENDNPEYKIKNDYVICGIVIDIWRNIKL